MTEQSLLLQSILLPFLAVFTYFDLRFKKIPTACFVLFAFTGIAYVIRTGDYANVSRYMGVLAGLVFLCLSILSKEAIGKGDALLFMILGWFLGIYQTMFLLFAAFSLCALASVLLLVLGKGNFKTTIPFLPFLYVALGGVCLL